MTRGARTLAAVCLLLTAAAGSALLVASRSRPDPPPVHVWIRADDPALTPYRAPGGLPYDGWTGSATAGSRARAYNSSRGDIVWISLVESPSAARDLLRAAGLVRPAVPCDLFLCDRSDDRAPGWREFVRPDVPPEAVPDGRLAGAWDWADDSGASWSLAVACGGAGRPAAPRGRLTLHPDGTASLETTAVSPDASWTAKRASGRWAVAGDVLYLRWDRNPGPPDVLVVAPHGESASGGSGPRLAIRRAGR